MKFFWAALICCLTLPASALDREAFTFTRYDLDLTVDSSQQRLGCRGKITLRNDSDSPQSNIVLQISSTLHWASIQLDGKPAAYVTQSYTSDIDHTGVLSEAILTLPKPIAPKGTIEISIGYEGVILQDATRLTRIGVPAETAKHSDWDQISAAFTGVRGIGYVAWYPIATEAASMSDASTVSEAVGRWKRRESGAVVHMKFWLPGSTAAHGQKFFCNYAVQGEIPVTSGLDVNCAMEKLGNDVPFFVLSAQESAGEPAVQVFYLPQHKSAAENYVLALNQVSASVSVWLGGHTPPKETKLKVIDLPDADAAPFEAGNTLLMPLTADDTSMLLTAVQQSARLAFPSPHDWISLGLARYAQARYVEQEKGRDVALGYLKDHRSALVEMERGNRGQESNVAENRALVNSADEFYVQAKAMSVWWMLRDLVGETAVIAALRSYRPEDDKDLAYMQKLLEAESHRDLTWFFDDWVYHDRGLPDLRIVSAYSAPAAGGGNLITVTVENLGSAATEAPVTLLMTDRQAMQKLVVPGRSKASVRILALSVPVRVVVNDGSVPEIDMSNNSYMIESQNQ